MTMNQHLRILHPTIIHQLTALFRHWPPSCIYICIHRNRFLFVFLQCWNILSFFLVMPFGKTTNVFRWFFFVLLFQTLFFLLFGSFLYSYLSFSLYCSYCFVIFFFFCCCCWLLLYVQKRKQTNDDDERIYIYIYTCIHSTNSIRLWAMIEFLLHCPFISVSLFVFPFFSSLVFFFLSSRWINTHAHRIIDGILLLFSTLFEKCTNRYLS